MTDKKYILYISNESHLRGVVTDIVTWSCPTASFYINYNFIGNNSWLNALLFLCFFVLLKKDLTTKDVTPDEARKIIDANQKIH